MSDLTIRDVAERIRGELPGLLGPEAPDALRALDACLDHCDDDGVVALLARYERTRERMDELLPEQLAAGERGFSPLPGHTPEPPLGALYRCPLGDYEWPAFEAGEDVPECPQHHVPLVLAE
jgi:hypothetical protein